MRNFLLAIFIMLTLSVGGRDLKKVRATYTLHAPESMSIELAKRTALTRAKLKAIEDEFGTVVSQSNVTRISTEGSKSDINFYSRGATDIKGEWVETIGEPTFNTEINDGMVSITVVVEGRIRKFADSRVDLQVVPLRNGTEMRFASTEFRNDDEFYMLFGTPIQGYVSVWLIDNAANTAYRILPYQHSSDALAQVDGNKNYVFFSDKKNSLDQHGGVDGIIMSCQADTEFDDLFVVFSSSAYSTPKLSTSGDFRSLPVDKFYTWLAKTRISHPELVVHEETLTIIKE